MPVRQTRISPWLSSVVPLPVSSPGVPASRLQQARLDLLLAAGQGAEAEAEEAKASVWRAVAQETAEAVCASILDDSSSSGKPSGKPTGVGKAERGR